MWENQLHFVYVSAGQLFISEEKQHKHPNTQRDRERQRWRENETEPLTDQMTASKSMLGNQWYFIRFAYRIIYGELRELR